MTLWMIHMNWICSVRFLKWPWLQTLNGCWRKCRIKPSHSIVGKDYFFSHLQDQTFKIHSVGWNNMCSILGSIQDERCFLAMAFIKNKLKNCLLCHLDLCTQFYVQQFYKLEDFLFEKAITLWSNMKTWYCIDSWK